MRHLSAWAAAFLFFAGFFLAFFDFWGVTPGSRISRKFTREGAAVPSKPRPGIRSPLGGAGRSAGGRGAGTAGGAARAARFFFARGRGGGGPSGGAPGAGRGGGFPPGEGGRGRAAARQKRGGACAGTGGLRRARARRAGGCPAAGRAGRRGGTRGQIRRAAAGRGGPGAGGKSVGRAGRGAGFFGAAPIFGGGGRKNPRFCFIRKRGFSPAFLCRIRADFSRKPCAFHRVAFSARRSDECVAAGKKAKNQKPPQAEKKRRAKREGTP